MGSFERSKKKTSIWKKATLHFLLCFVMGFSTGFAPISMFSSAYSPQPVEVAAFHHQRTQISNTSPQVEPEEECAPNVNDKNAPEEEVNVRRLVIVVTPTGEGDDKLRGVLLGRLAATLKLVARLLLWIVVEQKKSSDSEVSEILRRTGIMYRHVVLKENLTNVGSEMDHQRNIALNHIENHRLSGIVHFAGLSNVYDLSFFECLIHKYL